jgi:undecaprenyl-diphosphatase
MRLVDTVLLSALQGFTEVLPISRSGHGAVARMWLTADGTASALEGVLQLSTAVAAGVVARRRLAAALSEGVRGIARPSLFKTSPAARDAAVIVVASVMSFLVGALVRPYVEPFSAAPLAVGLGLVTTGVAIASVAFVPKSHVLKSHPEAPSMLGAAAVGVAHGLAAFPGASAVGAALTMLLWLGVKPGRALDLSLLIAIPALAAAFARALASARSAGVGASAEDLPLGTIAMGCVIAFLCATLAGSALRALMARRRLGALALWVIPLGLATLAYARALG